MSQSTALTALNITGTSISLRQLGLYKNVALAASIHSPVESSQKPLNAVSCDKSNTTRNRAGNSGNETQGIPVDTLIYMTDDGKVRVVCTPAQGKRVTVTMCEPKLTEDATPKCHTHYKDTLAAIKLNDISESVQNISLSRESNTYVGGVPYVAYETPAFNVVQDLFPGSSRELEEQLKRYQRTEDFNLQAADIIRNIVVEDKNPDSATAIVRDYIKERAEIWETSKSLFESLGVTNIKSPEAGNALFNNTNTNEDSKLFSASTFYNSGANEPINSSGDRVWQNAEDRRNDSTAMYYARYAWSEAKQFAQFTGSIVTGVTCYVIDFTFCDPYREMRNRAVGF